MQQDVLPKKKNKPPSQTNTTLDLTMSKRSDLHVSHLCTRLAYHCTARIYDRNTTTATTQPSASELMYVQYTNLYTVNYLLTFLLTPCSTVILEKLTNFQLVKKLPAFYGTRRFIQNCPPPAPIRNQLDPVHTPRPTS